MHYPFPILSIVIISVIILAVIYKNSDNKRKKEMEDFWDRENKAKMIPSKNLDEIEYLNVPVEKFSFGCIEGEDIKELEQSIAEFSKKRLINLTGKTNTELKEEYGTSNFDVMQAIGEDFDEFSIALTKYAKALCDNGLFKEAIPVLEYGLLIKTDISENYTLLGDCYKNTGSIRRIETLKDQVKTLGLLMENVIIAHLDSLIIDESDTAD